MTVSTGRDGTALVAGTWIEGVRVRPLAPHRDARGSFTEVFSQAWECGFAPAQWSVVRSARGTLRGMHLHRRHDEYFHVVQGRAHVGLRDLRPGSPTEGCSSLLELSAGEPSILLFPPGILHGWMFPEDSVHLQAVSETYGDYHADDNLGCRWDDPGLDIPWPERPTLLADRARTFPPLRDLLAETARFARNGEPWTRA